MLALGGMSRHDADRSRLLVRRKPGTPGDSGQPDPRRLKLTGHADIRPDPEVLLICRSGNRSSQLFQPIEQVHQVRG